MGLPRLWFLKHLIPKPTFQLLSKQTPKSNSIFNFPSNNRTYHFQPSGSSFDNSLHSKITLFVAGSPESSVIPFLEKWVQQGYEVRDTELQRTIRSLRSKRRFARALEVSEWLIRSQEHPFTGDRAVQLDLIGKVRGVDAAERYFKEVDDHSEKMYGALLNCYAREVLVDKSLALFQKMKDMGLAKHSLTYNSIMSLYFDTHQLEKVPEVFSEMVENNVTPDCVSYRMFIKSCGLKSDFTSIENIIQKMESRPHIKMEWSTYATVASHYIQGGLHERAEYFLQKAEERVHKHALGFNNLITMYATLGNTSKMVRLWKKKSTCTRQINIDYLNMIVSLSKLGEFEEAEKIFEEWEFSGNLYDFRVANALSIGYIQKGMVEKSESMLERLIDKGKTPTPNSWSIIASGYVGIQNMKKGVESMKKALDLGLQNRGWEPKPSVVSSLLEWICENEDIDEVKEFVNSLGRIVTIAKDREMYCDVLNGKMKNGDEVDGLLKSMKGETFDVDEEETHKIRSC